MKNACFLIAAVLFVLDNPSPASATPILFDWAFNINGVIYESCAGDALPDSFDDSGFDWDSGLGVLKIIYDPGHTGTFRIVSFFDHDVDADTTSFYNEYGYTGGNLSSGQMWEIDEPGYIYGDIYDHISEGLLDNTNGVTAGLESDVSLAIGWTLTLQDFEYSTLSFYLTQDPSFLVDYGGFVLAQTDVKTNETLYFYSTLDIHEYIPVPVPEPASALLTSIGIVGLAAYRKRALFRFRISGIGIIRFKT
ncbi:MAG TPA: PEP-CTERM sorting domain-containing protein [Desulfomonilia bacterium]|jgi:hypothetical protein|nr:PEP-CTERM sorting domain-containing protein [Desulfomonilia bacterium]HRR68644.1 PEP-CTERM sorting domain-containing protein [Desulfomonilia bacterium]HRT45089.1 PEP-CTERM sorting domain-containing protein [Desulfomonilia bacterium]